MYRHNRYFRQV